MSKKKKEIPKITEYVPVRIISAHCRKCKRKIAEYKDYADEPIPKDCEKCGGKMAVHIIFTDELRKDMEDNGTSK